jgi:beta-fructofuranosidase
VTAAGPRPGFHFGLPAGHLNDPIGLTWHDGRYDLFFQLNPDGSQWVPECRWGQSDGPDLVRWGPPRTALEPAPGEGCWSGSVAVAGDGTPVIVYTSVDTAAPDLGRIALARGRPDWSGWTLGGAVVAPPSGLDLRIFRDPFVWAVPGGWRMVVGAGTRDDTALVLQYSSPDLRRWELDGTLAQRRPSGAEPVPTGTAWECPQFFPLDGRWVLLVSAWDREPRRVVASVGEYDGRRFAPGPWRPFDVAGELYATTAFRDATGRWCALSWLPGARLLSVPYLLSLAGDRLRAEPHPDLDALLAPPVAELSGPVGSVAAGPVDPLVDVELSAEVPAGSRLRVAVTEDGGSELLAVLMDGECALLRRPRRPDAVLPRGRAPLRLLLDVGVAEAFSDGQVAALALGGQGAPIRFEVTAEGDGVRLDRLAVRPVRRWFGALGGDAVSR